MVMKKSLWGILVLGAALACGLAGCDIFTWRDPEEIADGDLDGNLPDGDGELDRDRDDVFTTDGDATDGDATDGDTSDGDEDEDFPIDGDTEEDADFCVCGPAVTDCCDGCDYIAGACTPTDPNALGGTCAEGVCLIDACVEGATVAPDRLSCIGSRHLRGAAVRPSVTGSDETRTVQMKLRWCPGVLRKGE